MDQVTPDGVVWCYNESKWLIFPVIDNIQTAVWISNNTLTWAATHLSVSEHGIIATCSQFSPEIFLGCTQSELISGDNYFRQPSGVIVRGVWSIARTRRETLSPRQGFHWSVARKRRFKHRELRCLTAKQVRSGGLAVACLDSPPTDRLLIKEGEERQHKPAVEALPHVQGDFITIWKKSRWHSEPTVHGWSTPMNDRPYATRSNMAAQK